MINTSISVSDYAALKTLPVAELSDGAQAQVAGYSSPGDGGAGLWTYDSASSATDDNGTILQPSVGSGRWLRSIRGVIDPRWFGFQSGSGAQDTNKAVWADLCDYCGANAGTTILLPPGTFYIRPNGDTVELNIPSNTTIQGSSGTHIILTYGETEPATSGSFSIVDPFRISGRSNVRISGFRLTGAITPSWLINSGAIAIYDSENVTVESMVINDAQVDGIYIKGGSNYTFDNVRITNPQRSCVSITAGDTMTFVNCRFEDAVTQDPWGGVNIETEDTGETVRDVTFLGCGFSGCTDGENGGVGLFIHRGQPVDPLRIQVVGGYFFGNGFGINAQQAQDITISGGTVFRENVVANIALTRASNCTVDGANINGAGRGIYLIQSQWCKAINNTIYGTTDTAIDFLDNLAAAPCTRNLVEGNHVYLGGGVGIEVRGNGNVVRRNEVHECQLQGILEGDQGASNHVEENHVYECGLAADNTYAGITVVGSGSVVRNNTTRKCYQSQGGTAQAGASGTITLATTAPSLDDVLNGFRVEIVSGMGSGQIKSISDYNGTSKVATVTVNFSPAPDSTSVYEILPGGNRQAYGIQLAGARAFVGGNDCIYGGATNNLLNGGTQTYLHNNRTSSTPTEGDWTGALVCGTSGTITMNGATGRYYKQDKAVTLTGLFSVTSVSSPVGTLTLTGLPFVAGASNKSVTSVTIRANNLTTGAITAIQGRIISGGSSILLERFEAGSAADMAATVKATTELDINVTYLADS